MIDPKELRIGNWVQYFPDEFVRVDSVGKDGINLVWGHDLTDYDYSPESIGPIPLTPEILEKCGFAGKYKSCGYYYQSCGIELVSQDEDDFGNSKKDYILHFYSQFSQVPIYYLHQLQNLYFALTGEELTYTP